MVIGSDNQCPDSTQAGNTQVGNTTTSRVVPSSSRFSFLPRMRRQVMKLLLIRHGETVDNVAHKYAGVTDSLLTNHGVLQTLRLGEYLTSPKAGAGAGLNFTYIFSSDLQRAAKTGQAILDAQLANTSEASNSSRGVNTSALNTSGVTVTQLPELREVDFGSREGTSYRSSHSGPSSHVAHGPDWRSRESNESMAARADRFIDKYLVPAIMDTHYNNANSNSCAIAVASHGIFLAILWMRLITRFWKSNITSASDFSGKRLHWSNTGYILLELFPGPPEEGLRGCQCLIEGMNVKTHLRGLGRTGGGVGSVGADGKQRQISGYLAKHLSGAGVHNQ